MAGQRQPIDLLIYKGKKNLTKKEIKERKAQEIKAPNDKVNAPSYLPEELKKEFDEIASELINIGIMSNLDNDALARFLLSKKMYLDVTESLLKINPITPEGEANEDYNKLLNSQDKLFKQSRAAASDLGLTISSRCKLVIPKSKDEKPKTRQEKKFGDRL